MKSSPTPLQGRLLNRLCGVLGAANVLLDPASRRLHSDDIYCRGQPAAAVLRPASTEQLQSVVRQCTEAGVPVFPRGGGMSYTGGYLPSGQVSVIIDLGRMDRIVEINSEDMYVKVECGCTWASLARELADKGLRTPFWGTLSGLRATIGGTLSQNGVFWGSGQFGTAGDSVLGLDVVLANGRLLQTGAVTRTSPAAFVRHYGPDLGGLFVGDCGALGLKAVATLPLIPQLPARAGLAFGFASAEQCLAAISELGRRKLPMECFGFDPFLQRQRMQRQSMTRDLASLAGVVRASASLGQGLRDGLGIVRAGRRYLDRADYSVQLLFEDRQCTALEQRLAESRAICVGHGGREIADSIPKLLRAQPFAPLNHMLGPNGERWLPVHGLLAHSKVIATYQRITGLIDRYRSRSEPMGIGTGYLFASLATYGVILEPVFFWPDELYPIHAAGVEPDYLARLPRHPPNPEARNLVEEMRLALIECFTQAGAAHFQIGRSYAYRKALLPDNWALIRAIKRELDPQGLINPGVLDLD